MSIFKSEDIKEIIHELEDDINYKIKEDDIKYVTKYSAIISESLVDSLLDALEKRGVKFTHVTIREKESDFKAVDCYICLLYTSPSPRDS